MIAYDGAESVNISMLYWREASHGTAKYKNTQKLPGV